MKMIFLERIDEKIHHYQIISYVSEMKTALKKKTRKAVI